MQEGPEASTDRQGVFMGHWPAWLWSEVCLKRVGRILEEDI